MKPLTLLVLSFALFVGAVGALYAFDQGARASSATTTAAVAATATDAPAATDQPVRQHRPHRRTVVRWAPCPDGATLENGVCVTDVVRTVTLPAPAAPAVSHTGTVSTPSSTHTTSGEHEGGDERGGGGGGAHEGGDD